jgi:hypothetical protein
MNASSPTTISLFLANVLPSHDLYASVVAADGPATTYNIQCAPGPDYTPPATTASAAASSSSTPPPSTQDGGDAPILMMPPATVTAAFCALPAAGETVTASGGSAFGGTEYWGAGMTNTWRCDLVPDPGAADLPSSSSSSPPLSSVAGSAAAVCVQSGGGGEGAVGITYTVPGATGLMKPVTVTGGMGMLGSGLVGVQGSGGGNGTGRKVGGGGRRRVLTMAVVVGAVLSVGIVQGVL